MLRIYLFNMPAPADYLSIGIFQNIKTACHFNTHCYHAKGLNFCAFVLKKILSESSH